MVRSCANEDSLLGHHYLRSLGAFLLHQTVLPLVSCSGVGGGASVCNKSLNACWGVGLGQSGHRSGYDVRTHGVLV